MSKYMLIEIMKEIRLINLFVYSIMGILSLLILDFCGLFCLNSNNFLNKPYELIFDLQIFEYKNICNMLCIYNNTFFSICKELFIAKFDILTVRQVKRDSWGTLGRAFHLSPTVSNYLF